MDIDAPMKEENKEVTPQVDEIDKNSKVSDEDKVDVPDVDINADDIIITLGFIPDGDLLAVEGVDSVNKHKDTVKDDEDEGKNAKENKEEEKEDKEDGNDEEKYKENDKDDKDDLDKGEGKVID
ncbi:hypothetical protein PanWU01x14_087880 [Parasponia andersonii]|uniref:Uncharacterized protein n=1 Tax=Parasponia andersonii TaxID=3476 RepID=A0A2P5D7T1_PARAD|nr:hypothetical protein PanWU01x14_087880 [Parasponia andersonii]